MEKVLDVARWFRTKGDINYHKLQRLCYYAQAWHCALFGGEPLFGEQIEAWTGGPEIIALQYLYTKYFHGTIPKIDFDPSHMSGRAIQAMETAWAKYGTMNAKELSEQIKSEAPWLNARGTLRPWDVCRNTISCEDMRETYEQMGP